MSEHRFGAPVYLDRKRLDEHREKKRRTPLEIDNTADEHVKEVAQNLGNYETKHDNIETALLFLEAGLLPILRDKVETLSSLTVIEIARFFQNSHAELFPNEQLDLQSLLMIAHAQAQFSVAEVYDETRLEAYEDQIIFNLALEAAEILILAIEDDRSKE